jgi:hypothetical protein
MKRYNRSRTGVSPVYYVGWGFDSSNPVSGRINSTPTQNQNNDIKHNKLTAEN